MQRSSLVEQEAYTKKSIKFSQALARGGKKLLMKELLNIIFDMKITVLHLFSQYVHVLYSSLYTVSWRLAFLKNNTYIYACI